MAREGRWSLNVNVRGPGGSVGTLIASSSACPHFLLSRLRLVEVVLRTAGILHVPKTRASLLYPAVITPFGKGPS